MAYKDHHLAFVKASESTLSHKAGNAERWRKREREKDGLTLKSRHFYFCTAHASGHKLMEKQCLNKTHKLKCQF